MPTPRTARDIALKVASAFGSTTAAEGNGKKNKKAKAVTEEPEATEPAETPEKASAPHTGQLVFISPDERRSAIELAEQMFAGTAPSEKVLPRQLLRAPTAPSISPCSAACSPTRRSIDREAAVQVSHAITTHAAQSEDDYFTAVDDLKPREDSGAGHSDEHGFGSGVYYLYACVNCDLLLDNLAGDAALAARAIEALVEGLATATPSGKQNSFAHHPRAAYIRAEVGIQQPRDLTGAFFDAVKKPPLLDNSVTALEDMAAKLDKSYGPMTDAVTRMDVAKGEGTLAEIKAFSRSAVESAAQRVARSRARREQPDDRAPGLRSPRRRG